ncbi:NAD-dependent epimerase/dehydratase family protein [Rubidibacter lacunae]|nr:NAD-dependent epimerase/dehydratase family protein [Rubidibacter lacunae]
MRTLITGATGLTGGWFLQRLAVAAPQAEVVCLVRPTGDRAALEELDLKLKFAVGDSSEATSWKQAIAQWEPDTIVHLAQLRHVPPLLASLRQLDRQPRAIVIGTTGVFSRYNEYSRAYKAAEAELEQYPGSTCLLRPTMIYGSPRDKNIHKLVRFCDRYGLFPVFGPGNNLLQPVHADDLAQALLSVWQCPDIEGAYDLSGGTVVSFRELLQLVGSCLGKPVRLVSLPYQIGVWAATTAEFLLGDRSPVRREQILRLQEDKAFSHAAAQQDFGFAPRSLPEGLEQEIELMRQAGLTAKI